MVYLFRGIRGGSQVIADTAKMHEFSFENSGHDVPFEETDKFIESLLNIKAEVLNLVNEDVTNKRVDLQNASCLRQCSQPFFI